MYGMRATWRMAYEGVEDAIRQLAKGTGAGDALVAAIQAVEDEEYYKSVGYGGLPNEEMVVELDAGYMDGDTLSIGCVGAIRDFSSPICIARALSDEPVNNFLVGEGAEKYAHRHGFARKNMLSERAKIHYQNRVKELKQTDRKPYSGHDTVGMICLDIQGHMTAGTSTSGLFMKHAGRIGDSPIAGSGFYVDSQVGGASATGLGEDVMKGCVSYEIVRLMREGKTPQEACEQAVRHFDAELRRRRGQAGDMSLVAMNNKGEWGAATNIDTFSFVVATAQQPPTVYLVKRDETGNAHFEQASAAWMEDYVRTRKAAVERK